MCLERTLSMEELLQKLEVSLSKVRSSVELINTLSSNYGLASQDKCFDNEDKEVFVDALYYQRNMIFIHKEAIRSICREIYDRAEAVIEPSKDV